MKNKWFIAAVLGVIGLVLGYILFGKIGKEYISLAQFFGADKGNIFKQLTAAIRSELLLHIRWNVIFCGALGVCGGLIAGSKMNRR